MTDLTSGTPFDQVRKIDEKGQEYWSARELMPLLGYEKWERFNDAIDRAKLSAGSTGIASVEVDFPPMGNRPTTGGRDRIDYRLSRRACWLVAMNGDPRKPEIAAAQAYFVVMTEKAEKSADVKPDRVAPLSMKRSSSMMDHAELLNRMAIGTHLRRDLFKLLTAIASGGSDRDSVGAVYRDAVMDLERLQKINAPAELKKIIEQTIAYEMSAALEARKVKLLSERSEM